MKTITLRLEDTEHRKLKQAALDAGVSMQELLLKGATPSESQPLEDVSPEPKVVAPPKKKLIVPPEVAEEFKRESPRERMDREDKERLRKRWGV